MSAAFWRSRSSSVSPVGAIACSGTSVVPSGRVERDQLLEQADATHEEVHAVDVSLRVRVPALLTSTLSANGFAWSGTKRKSSDAMT